MRTNGLDLTRNLIAADVLAGLRRESAPRPAPRRGDDPRRSRPVRGRRTPGVPHNVPRRRGY